MGANRKRMIKQAARTGASGLGGILLLILKILGTLLLIIATTGVIFACIFVIYIKTNLITSDLDIRLDEFTINQTSIVYYEDPSTGGYRELTQLQGEQNRIWVDYEDIPEDLEHAVVAIEDKRFYKHDGVDWYRTAGAFVNMFVGMRDTFGGSTITQQLIKNLTGETEGTVQRKLTEIFRALEFEKDYDKWEIIEGYLNIVYFGHRQYGIGAAADYYFGKEVKDLTLAEMCSIVGITNNPSLYSPKTNPENNKKRQENILDAMLDQGYISQEEHDQAVAEKLNFAFNRESSGDSEVYSYFVDTLIEDCISFLMEKRGVSYDVAELLLFNSGYQIYSTIDVSIQDKVDSIYEDLEQIPQVSGSSDQVQSAIVITDPYTGNIVALSGGVGEKTVSRGLNRASGSLARRPPGSSFKPIAVYAPAMDIGIITPDTKYEDEPDIVLNGTNWYPYNDSRSNRGVVTIRQAIISSLNTIAAQVMDDMTPQVSYDFLVNKLNITSLEPEDCDYAPLALGQLTYGVTPREMAQAYGIFVNDGTFTEARTFTKICDADGKLLYENEPDTHVAISPATAYWMTDILHDAANYGTGYESSLSNMPNAGKTGTTSSRNDRWFCGYTPYYVAAVWMGYDTPTAMSASGNPSAQLWNKVMTLVHEDLEYREFSTPENTYLSPVAGVSLTPYYIRGITTSADGSPVVLYDEEAGAKAAGRAVTVTAKEVEGYTLSGAAEATITLTENTDSNVAEFMYTPVAQPDDPEDPNVDPDAPGIVTDPDTDPDNPDPKTDPDDSGTAPDNPDPETDPAVTPTEPTG